MYQRLTDHWYCNKRTKFATSGQICARLILSVCRTCLHFVHRNVLLGKTLKLVLKLLRQLVHLRICMSATCSSRIMYCLLAAWLLRCCGCQEVRGLTDCAGFWQLPVQWISGSEGLQFVCVHRVMLKQMSALTKIYSNTKILRFFFSSFGTTVQFIPCPPQTNSPCQLHI